MNIPISDMKLSLKWVSIRKHKVIAWSQTYFDKASTIVVGHFLYVVGPLEIRKGNSFLAVVGVVDLKKKRWRFIEYTEYPVTPHSLFLYDDALYAFRPENRGKELSKFDLSLEKWSVCSVAGDEPDYEEPCATGYLENCKRFVVVTEIEGANRTKVRILPMPQRRWIKPIVKGWAPAKYGQCACVHEGSMYYVGANGGGPIFVNNLYRLEHSFLPTETVTWSGFHCGFPWTKWLLPFNGKFLICGQFSELYEYDPEDKRKTSFNCHLIQLSRLEETIVAAGGKAFALAGGLPLGFILGNPDKGTSLVSVTEKQ